jgi:hypothetical protein
MKDFKAKHRCHNRVAVSTCLPQRTCQRPYKIRVAWVTGIKVRFLPF